MFHSSIENIKWEKKKNSPQKTTYCVKCPESVNLYGKKVQRCLELEKLT